MAIDCEFHVDFSSFDAIFFGFFGTGVNVVGIVGNLMALLVLIKERRRSPTFVYLITLTTTSTIWLLVATWEFNLTFVSIALKLQHKELHIYQDFLREVNELANTWVLTTFCFERWRAVSRPLRHRAGHASPRHVVGVVGVLIVFAVAANVPRFFEHAFEAAPMPACLRDSAGVVVNVTYWGTQKTALRRHPVYVWAYKLAFTYSARFFVPLLLLFCFNIRIILCIRKEASFRAKSSVAGGAARDAVVSPGDRGNRRRIDDVLATPGASATTAPERRSWAKSTERQVTLICASVVTAFLVTSLPYFLASLMRHSGVVKRSPVFDVYRRAAIFLTNFNCCLLFVVLFVLSPQYRDRLVRLVTWKGNWAKTKKLTRLGDWSWRSGQESCCCGRGKNRNEAEETTTTTTTVTTSLCAKQNVTDEEGKKQVTVT